MHYLKPVRKGHRITASFHLESMVRDTEKRTILFDMDNSIRSMINENLNQRSISSLTGIYHNLLRMWSDI
jgi:PKHD-type hydroxylase